MLKPEVIRTLQDAAADLRAQRETIDADLKAIEAVLARETARETAPAAPSATSSFSTSTEGPKQEVTIPPPAPPAEKPRRGPDTPWKKSALSREERNAEIRRRDEAGESRSKIAKDFELSHQRISQICKEPPPKLSTYKPILKSAMCGKACDHDGCKSFRHLAAQFCSKCSERIGYDTGFSVNAGKYEHTACPKKAAS